MAGKPLRDEKLALDGGRPCVVEAPDRYWHGAQELGEEEIAAVSEVLRSGNVF